MSKTVENQVVAMQFDNRHFESNVKTSLSTLDKLKKSLKLQDAAKGFENVSAAARKVNLNPIGSACQTVGLKFNALYTVADQAMRNITNSVQRAATNIVNSFTLDPIKTGFQEYETQINAVQTILANTQSKGTTLDDVNNALDTLNTYADKTIYNFTEMTRNIGTFTAAGVDLDTSVNAIQGIANLAAVSGSNAQQASTAMYQLSQALASGTVKLMDWNSVVNAGMGGQVFQDALKETARVHNVKIDEMIKKQGSFRETLSEGWLTSEILTETLQKFTLTTEGLTDAQIEQNRQMLKSKGYTDAQIDKIFELGKTATDAATKVKTFTQLLDTLKEAAQSGWTQTWELLVGDFEQAKFLWTGISETIGGFINKTSESRNKLLAGALQNSGWDKLVEKINEAKVSTEDFEEAVKDVATKEGLDVEALVKEYGSLEGAVQAGKISTDMLKKSLDNLKKSSDKFNLDGITGAFKRYATGKDVKLIEEALKKAGFEPVGKNDGKSYVDEYFGTATVEAVKRFQEAKGLKVTGIIDEKTLAALKEATKETAELTDEIYELVDGVTALGGREKLIEIFKNAWSGAEKIFGSIKKSWDDVFPAMKPEELMGIIESVNEFSKKLVVSDETADKFGRTFKGIFSVLNLVGDFIGGALKLAFGGLTKMVEILGPILLSITGALGDFFSFLVLKKDEAISTISEWIKKVSELPIVKETIDKVKKTFSDFFSPVTEGWKKFTDMLKNPFTVDENGEKRLLTLAEVFENFKTNVVEKFQNLDFSGMFTELSDKIKTAFKSLFGGASDEFEELAPPIVKAADAFQDIFKDFDGGSENIENFKLNIGDAANAVSEKFFGVSFDIEKVTSSVAGFFKKVGKLISENKGKIIALGTLIGVLFTVKKVSNILEKLASPLSFFEDLGDAVKNFGLALKANAIKGIATGITMLVASLIALAFVPWQKLAKATVFLALVTGILVGAFAALSFAAKSLGNVGDIGKVALSLLGLAGALFIFGLAAMTIGKLDWGTLGKTAAVLAGFTFSLKAITKVAGTDGAKLAGIGSAFIGLAGALLIFAGAVAIFGSMDNGTLLKGGAAVIVCLILMKSIIKATDSLPVVGENGSILKIGGVFMAMATSLLLIAAAVAIFGNMKTGTLLKGGLAVLTFMGVMILVMKATNSLLKVGDKSSIVKVGGIFASMGAALLLMAASVAILGSLKTSTLLKGGAAVLVLLSAMVGIMAATKLLAKTKGWESFAKISGMILSFSASILLLAGAIAILSFIKPEDIAKGVLTIAGIGVVFMGLIAVTRNIPAKSVGAIIGLAGAVTILVASLIALTYIDAGELKTAGIALGGVIAMFAALTASTKFISFKAVAAVALLGVIVAGLAYVISQLSKIGAKEALAASGAISLLMASLSVSLLLVSKATNNGNISIGGIVKMGLALAAIGAVAAGLAWLTIKNLPTIGTKIGEFINAIVGPLNSLTDVDSSVLSSIGILFKAMGELAAGVAKFAWADFATNGKASAAFTEFTSWINQILPIVKSFALDLTGVNINTENLKSVVGAVRDLAEAASLAPTFTIAGGGFGSKWGGGGAGIISVPMLTAAKDWIVGVTPVVQSLALEVSKKGITINTKNLDAVVDGAKALAEAADSAPSITAAGGGFTSKWVSGGAGVISHPMLSAAKDWIVKVAPVVEGLAESITTGELKNLDVEKLGAICTGAKTLAEAAANVPTVDFGAGGFGSKWGGGGALVISHPMLSAAADWMASVKDPIVKLATAVGTTAIPDFNAANLTAIVDGVVKLSEAAANVPTVDAGGAVGYSKLFGLIVAGGISHPMISATASFIDSIIDPMKSLAAVVAGAELKELDVKKFNAIIKAVVDIASADYPTLSAGGLINVNAFTGFTLALGGTAPQIGKISSFITSVKDPIIALANATTTGLTGKFNKANFESIVDAITGIASANYPTTTAGGFLGFSALLGGAAGGGYYSASDVTAVKDFIVNVKQPIIDLANATSTGLSTKFNKTNFESVIGAIKDIASVDFPTYTEANLTGLSGLIGFASGKYISGTNIKAVEEFIVGVKQPMIDLANAVSGVTDDDGAVLTEGFKKDNFNTIIKAIVDLASVKYPGIENVDLEIFGTLLEKLQFNAKQESDFNGFVGFVERVKDPIINLAKAVSGEDVSIDSEKLTSIVDAVKRLAEGASFVPTTGSIKDWWTGIPNFSGFTEFLGGLAGPLTTLTTNLSTATIDPSKISTATAAVKALAEASNAIPNKSEWWQFWTSSTDWDGFVTNIPKFGEAISSFSGKLGDINTESVSTASNSVKYIAEAIKYLYGLNMSEMSTIIGTFKDQLGPLGTAIKSFADGVSEINVDTVTTATDVIYYTADAFSTLESIEWENVDIGTFGSKLSELATAISNFAIDASTVDPTAAITNLKNLIGALTSISSADFTGAGSFKKALTELANTSIDDFTAQWTDANVVSSIQSAAGGLMDGAVAGIEAKQADIETAADSAVLAGSSAIGSITNYTAYYTAGAYVGAGFVAGISSMLGAAAAAGTSLGKAALEAAKAALQEHSPSKAFYEVGEFAGMGLINALHDYERTTYKAGYGVGDSANAGLGDAISRVKDLIENGMSDQPTIRPVLDLSAVSAGADGINRMFDMHPAVGVTGKLGDISAMIDNGQNGTNDDVIAAINNLGGKISESGRDTYNINGITYDDGSNITDTVKALIRAVLMEGRA